jgi:hypothetical protein
MVGCRQQGADTRAGPGDGRVGSRLGRLMVLSIAAVVALSLPACGGGADDSASSSKTSTAPPGEPTGGSALPRDVVLPLSAVKEVLPEMTHETATGENEGAVGNPTGTRSVTYATGNGSRRVVISVDRYESSAGASSAYQEATQKSKEVPGAKGETVSDLGEKAFIGVVTQGDETHVGGGALYGGRIVAATLQGYDGTNENKAKVTEIIRKQAVAAKRAL